MRQRLLALLVTQRRLVLVLVAPLLVLTAVTAWAYWTSHGSGSAAASVAALGPPTGVTATATAGSGTVPVSWTAGATPNGGSVTGYYVQRFAGTTPTNACGSSPVSLLAATPASCSDTSVSDGTYTYTVTAVFRSWTATSAASASVNVVNIGPATKLAFTTSPSNSTGGVAFGTQPVVTIQDANGQTVTGDASTVTLTITAGTGTAGAVLTCTADPKAAVAGIATFAGCKTDKAGAGYTFTATDGGLAPATSSTFNITAGVGAKLSFTASPGAATGGLAFGTQPVVTVQDAGGNPATGDTSNVTLAITTSTGTAGAVLTCAADPKAAVVGIATFAGCKIDKAGAGYTLTATDGGLAPATSSTFNITAGVGAKLSFTAPPGNATGGVAFGTQPVVTVQDAGGNTATGDASNVTLAITTSTGTAGAVLTCTADPKAAVAGIATFAGCKIDKAGAGYTLTATDGGLAPATSGTFNVTAGVGVAFVVTGYATPTVAGVGHSLTVTAIDAVGNIASGYTGVVKFTSTDPQATLPANYPFVSGDGGQRTFSGVTLKTAGSQSIIATDNTTSSITGSQSITVNAAAATVMAFVNCSIPTSNASCSGQPIVVSNNTDMTFQIQTQDTFGNPSAPTVTISVTFTNSDGTFSVTAGSPATITSPVTTSGTVTLHHGVNGGTDTLTAKASPSSFADVALTAKK